MDQIITFVGRSRELADAVNEAQSAANIWLQEHSISIATVYSATSQSAWQEHGGTWHHVIMLALQLYNTSSGAAQESAANSTA